MREWCSCGSSIRARRKDVLAWRGTHKCNTNPEPEPDKQGAQAYIENAGYRGYETNHDMASSPVVIAQIGFQPNA